LRVWVRKAPLEPVAWCADLSAQFADNTGAMDVTSVVNSTSWKDNLQSEASLETDVAWDRYLDELQQQQTAVQHKLDGGTSSGLTHRRPDGQGTSLATTDVAGKGRSTSKGKGAGAVGQQHIRRLEREVAELQMALKQTETELSSKATECSTLKVDIDEQAQKMHELKETSAKTEKRLELAIQVAEEESAVLVDELRHKIKLLEMDKQTLEDELAIFDTLEVERHNSELRAQVQALQETRLEERGRGNDIKERQRAAVAQLKYQLEREFRSRLRAAEELVRRECLQHVHEDARNAIVQRDQLTSFLYKTGSEINIVNKKFSLLDDSNRQRAAELGAVQELNQEQARIAVSLRHQLQKANVENNALAHKLAEAEAQVRPHGPL